jgi:transcription elongation factor Elf1
MSIPIESKYVRLLSSRLRNFKQKKDYLWNFSCNFCGDSQKNKTKARGYVFAKGNNLFYRCHNCGVSVGVGNLIKAVDESLYKEFVLEKYKSGEINNTHRTNKIFNIQPPRFDKLDKQKVFEHGEWLNKLPPGHFCLEYATKRQIPLKYYDKLLFTQHYNQFVTTLIPNHGKKIVDDARLVLPFYDEYNELIAVSGRALETGDKTLRYVTIRTNDNQKKLIYGMDRVDLNQPVRIVEGPLDSLFIENCIASGDANLVLCADEISSDKIILIYDNEKRNKEIVKMIQNAIKLQHYVVIWPDTIQGKDINEIILFGKSQGEIEKIISNNTFKGIEAQVKFNMWKKV